MKPKLLLTAELLTEYTIKIHGEMIKKTEWNRTGKDTTRHDTTRHDTTEQDRGGEPAKQANKNRPDNLFNVLFVSIQL